MYVRTHSLLLLKVQYKPAVGSQLVASEQNFKKPLDFCQHVIGNFLQQYTLRFLSNISIKHYCRSSHIVWGNIGNLSSGITTATGGMFLPSFSPMACRGRDSLSSVLLMIRTPRNLKQVIRSPVHAIIEIKSS